VAIAVAADREAPVSRLILEDPPLSVFSDQSIRVRTERERFVIWRDLIAARPTTELLWRKVVRSMPDAPMDAVGQRVETLRQVDPAVLLLQANVEVGGALEPSRAERARLRLRDCTSVYLPEVGHGIHDDEPFRFCDLVRRFV